MAVPRAVRQASEHLVVHSTAVVAGPEGVADALGGVEVVVAVPRAVRQACEHLVVHSTAVGPRPAGLAHARPFHAAAVAAAGWVNAVN